MSLRQPGRYDKYSHGGGSFELPEHDLAVVLKHDDILPFVRIYFRKWNPVMLAYWSFSLIIVAATVFFLLTSGSSSRLVFFFMGFVLFFFLVPIHELIHGIGYRLAGARKVTYKAVWRKLVFYAMADGFFTGRKQFVLLAIAPFALINSLLILVVFSVPESYSAWLAAGALVMHTAGCAGDFALISYFFENWKYNPVVCDDVENGLTRFYLEKQSPE
jgi:hypothetical protein